MVGGDEGVDEPRSVRREQLHRLQSSRWGDELDGGVIKMLMSLERSVEQASGSVNQPGRAGRLTLQRD